MSDSLTETKALIKLQRAELHDHILLHREHLPRLAVANLWGILGEMDIALRNWQAPVELLAKGTVE